MGGVAITRLTIQKINMFILPIPPLSLQENYCDKIRVLEKQKELISKSITDVQQLFDYTMDKYFN
jgi:type I restriction enzyme S subunit